MAGTQSIFAAFLDPSRCWCAGQSSGFAPPNALEPAIISMRPLGNTTAIVSVKNGTTERRFTRTVPVALSRASSAARPARELQNAGHPEQQRQSGADPGIPVRYLKALATRSPASGRDDGVGDAIKLRSVLRLTTSSFSSLPFGVSSTFGILRKRGSFMIKRNAASPILPLPMCACRSTREPRAVLESLR